MEDYGLVSIITPNWNCAHYISETIKSVQAQTYQNWEMIIVDDCSTDESESLLELFLKSDSRIRLLRNAEKSGAAISRNYALREARGRWVAFLDADDLWLPNKLERQLQFMIKFGYRFTYTCYQEMDEVSDDTGVVVRGPKHISKFGMYLFCWLGCLTVMYDRNAIGLIQVPDIKKNNDYAMWLEVSRNEDCHLLDETLAKYRRGRVGSISSHNYMTLMRWHYNLWHEAENKSIGISLFLTFVNLVCGMYKKMFYVKRVS